MITFQEVYESMLEEFGEEQSKKMLHNIVRGAIDKRDAGELEGVIVPLPEQMLRALERMREGGANGE